MCITFCIKPCSCFYVTDISSVSLAMVCLLHFIKLSCQVYHYQPDSKRSHSKRTMHRTHWVTLEATVLSAQLLQRKVYPHLLPNLPLQAPHRLFPYVGFLTARSAMDPGFSELGGGGGVSQHESLPGLGDLLRDRIVKIWILK